MSLASVVEVARLVNRFTRFTCFGFTCLPLIVGASTVRSDLTFSVLGPLVCLSTSLHLHAYVMNDLCDLSIDRANPRRSRDPLVTGHISTRFARRILGAQLTLAIACLGWSQVSVRVYSAAAICYITVFLYNYYGKRLSIPGVADALVGIAGASAVLTGALMVADHPSPSTWYFAVAHFLFLMMVNLLHGGLRDLSSDHLLKAKTSMLIMGARATTYGYHLPTVAIIVSLLLQSLVTVAAIGVSGTFPFVTIPSKKHWMMLFCLLIMILSWTAFCQAARWRHSRSRSTKAGLIHLLITYIGINIPVFYYPNNPFIIVAALVFVLPLLCGSWLSDIRSGLVQT